MKTLRIARNAAALFILAIALLSAHPAAANRKCVLWGCVSAPGYRCQSDFNTCSSTKCTDKKFCSNQACSCLY